MNEKVDQSSGEFCFPHKTPLDIVVRCPNYVETLAKKRNNNLLPHPAHPRSLQWALAAGYAGKLEKQIAETTDDGAKKSLSELFTFLQKINPEFNDQMKRYSKSFAEPTKMKEQTGNLIDLAKNGEFDVIVHGCNCECIMGGGIAKQIKMAFPAAYEADCGTQKADASKIGGISYAKVKLENNRRLVIVNGYTQLLSGGQVNYDAVRGVMKQVKQNFYGQRIGYPMIGAGLAGGEWNRIREIIDEELNDEDHTLVQLPTYGKGSKTHPSKSKRQKTDNQGGTATSPSAASSNPPDYSYM
jgi:O-acetyl-ADP-ribose deacetylase (regulator of RNase III)